MARLALPQAPALVAGHGRAALLTPDGELLTVAAAQLPGLLRGLEPPLLVHAPASFRRLGLRPGPAYDLLSLFAFVLPAQSATPTPRGLALALGLDPPGDPESAAALLPDLALTLLQRLAQGRAAGLDRDAAGLAAWMGRAGWGWAPYVMAALGRPDAAPSIERLRIWKHLPEWDEEAPLPPPGAIPVAPTEARARLAAMLGPAAETRPGQADYASAASAAFAPREHRGEPHAVLAEAGTGTGK
ncbi:MAG TPA: ATP-dependent DNA helicase, partial [Acetobacteraceae bacterium]|nr:ATP-dependent DNA helicase [Acetobacteraceae bacterium]